MTRKAELYDGTVMEFPDDTKDEVIERVAKEQTKKLKESETTPTDVAKGVGTGAIVGGLMGTTGAGLAGFINDAVQVPAQIGYRGIDAVLGTNLAARHERSTGGFMGTTGALTERAQKVAGAVVPAPTSAGGKIAQAVTSGGVEALAGSGLFRVAGKIFTNYDDAVRFAEQAALNPEVRAVVNPRVAGAVRELGEAPVMQGVYGAAAAGGGEIAEQVGVDPLIGTGIALAGTVAAHTAPRVVRAGGRAIEEGVESTLLRSEDAQKAAAAEKLREVSKDKPALQAWAVRAQEAEDAYQAEFAKGNAADQTRLGSLDQARREAHGELVKGSTPTLFEATDITGVGHAERNAFTKGTGDFKIEIEERRAAQNQARLDELRRLAGEGTPDEILTEFRKQRDEIDAATAAEERAAQAGAAATAERAGTTATPETVGEQIRAPVVAAERSAKQEGGRLYDAIAAEGVTVGTGRLKAAVGREFRDIPESPLTGDEKHFADLIKGYGGSLEFDLLQKLRSEVAGRARQFTLPDTVRRRFTLLKNAIDQAMDDGLAKAIKDDPSLGQRAAANASVPLDDTLTQAQRAANTHWREMKQTFGADPVKPIVARAPTASGFKMTEAKIPETAFRPGNTGGEHIRAMRAAGATNESLAEAAALSFSDPKRGVIRDGAVDPAGFRRWLNNHAAAIRELPPEVQRRFSSAASAAATLEEVTARRTARLHDFDQSAVGKVLNIPVENLSGAIKSYLENPAASNRLAAAVAGNPAAKAGLQRLVADHILARFTDASDVLSKASLTKYVKSHESQLTAIFGKEGAERFRRVAADIERSRKQLTSGKDPAGPSTAADLFKAAGADTTIMMAAASLFGAPGVAAYGIGKHLLGTMRQAGINNAEQLYARALLDPESARKLLTKAPALKNEKFRKGLGTTILRSSLAGMAYGGNQ